MLYHTSSSPPTQLQELIPLLLQNMLDRAIFMVDVTGHILSWAPGVQQLLGYEEHEFVGRSIAMLFACEEWEPGSTQKLLQQVEREGRVEEERQYRRKNGSYFWGHGPIIPLHEGKHFHGFGFLIRDSSEQKRAQERLQNSEAQLAAIFTRAAVGMSEISLGGHFLRVNDELCRMLGRSRDELLSMGVREVTHPDDLSVSLTGFNHLLHTGESVSLDKRYIQPDGVITWANSSLIRLEDSAGHPYSVLAVTVDLTERHYAQEALRKAHDQLEERVRERTAELSEANEARVQLLHQVVTAQEEERRRIARELHDQLGQSLVALGMGLESVLTRGYSEQMPAELQNRLEHLHTMTRGLMDEVHNLAWQLRPAALDELGLEVALRQMVNQWQHNTGIPADFLSSSALKAPKPALEIEVALYRVTQECLNNITRHANASSVSVVFKHSRREVKVIVEDDGRGFDLESVNANAAKRLGVVGMRERLEHVGGSLVIETSPGAGTSVYARVPLASPSED